VKSSRIRFRPGERTNAIQVRKIQNNRRCPLNIENEIGAISGFPRPVVVSPTAKLRTAGRPEILAMPPDESRYGEKEVKIKSAI
jgi:hypothetical protein